MQQIRSNFLSLGDTIFTIFASFSRRVTFVGKKGTFLKKQENFQLKRDVFLKIGTLSSKTGTFS
mgnify:CR=1 FL=1